MREKRKENVIAVPQGIILYKEKTRFSAICTPIIIDHRVSGQEQMNGISQY